MAHIAFFASMHWPVLKEPLGFLRDHPPHATTISRTLAGVPYEQLQSALSGWVARVVADQEDQELNASVDGRAKQSVDANGNPLVMVNVLAHDLKLCLAQWPASEKRYEPAVLREQLGRLFQSYPGLGLLSMDALYAERDLCQAIVSHGRDYLVGLPGGTTWWDYLVGLPGGTTWWDYLVGLPGGTTWWDYLVGLPGGTTWWDYLVGIKGNQPEFRPVRAKGTASSVPQPLEG